MFYMSVPDISSWTGPPHSTNSSTNSPDLFDSAMIHGGFPKDRGHQATSSMTCPIFPEKKRSAQLQGCLVLLLLHLLQTRQELGNLEILQAARWQRRENDAAVVVAFQHWNMWSIQCWGSIIYKDTYKIWGMTHVLNCFERLKPLSRTQRADSHQSDGFPSDMLTNKCWTFAGLHPEVRKSFAADHIIIFRVPSPTTLTVIWHPITTNYIYIIVTPNKQCWETDHNSHNSVFSR